MTNASKVAWAEDTIQHLKALQGSGDTEAAHAEADNEICLLLSKLGFADVVAEYQKVEKWYA